MSQYPPQDFGAAPQPPAAGQPGYPPAHPGYPQPYPVAPEHPQGTMILVLGVASLACSPLGFASWYLGKKAEDEIEASGNYYANAGNIKAGKIIGMVTGILTIAGVAFMLVYIAIMLIMFGSMFAMMPR